MSPEADRRVLLGHIADAHGIRGEVKIRSYTSDPADIAAYGPLSDDDGRRSFVIQSHRVSGSKVVARIEGISDRDAAEALKGVGLFVARDRLPRTEDEEWYVSDLIGCRALESDGGTFGQVVGVHSFGAGDLLEIKPAGRSVTVLLPFTRACVPAVDLAASEIIVAPPPGLLDEGAQAGDQRMHRPADDASDNGD